MKTSLRSLFKRTLLGVVASALVTVGHAQMFDGYPPKDTPATPGWGFYPKWPEGWNSLHEKLVKRSAKGGVDVMFLGDSLVFNWAKEGKAEWTARFAPLNAENYGIGSDSTRQVIWRLQNGEMDGITPKLVVLHIGTNNIYSDHNSGKPEEIVAGVERIVALIREKSPSSKILILGVLPRQDQGMTGRVYALNGALSFYTKKNNIPYADFAAKFKGKDDVIDATLYKTDRVHLSAAGYKLFADLLEPVVKEQLAAKR